MRIGQLSAIFAGVLTLGAAAWAVSSVPTAGANWPNWRGPDSNGVAQGSPPVEFGPARNLKWKTSIPGRGMATPIIWEDKVFIATAIPVDASPSIEAEGIAIDPAPQQTRGQRGRRGRGGRRGGGMNRSVELVTQQFVLLCLDRATGDVLWSRTCNEAMPHEGHHPQYGSYASASPVTDGERVYVNFGTWGVYAFDMDGAPVWDHNFGVQIKIFLGFGEGTSPALHGDVLLVKADHQEGGFIHAFDKRTGDTLWHADREDTRSWSAPLIVEVDGRAQAIMSGNATAVSYDLLTGEVLWSGQPQGGNAIVSAVGNGDLVYFKGGGRRASGFQAVAPSARGDLSEAGDAVAWAMDSVGTSGPTPSLAGDELYILSDRGMLSLYHAATGEPIYENQRVGGAATFKSSPVVAGGQVYMTSEQGEVLVARRGPEFEMLSSVDLGEMLIASPAIAGDELFIRGMNTLFCFAESGR